MKRVLQEPLLHFLVLGAILFAVHGYLDRMAAARPGEIVVSAGHVEHLAATFTRFQQRPPSAEELKELVDRHVREEIMSREAVQLGLDQDDSVIRRRLQQKLEFIASDLATDAEPTEDELAAWLARHPDDFLLEARLSFRQVCLLPDRRGDQLDSDASRLLAELRQAGGGIDIEALGDSLLLPHEFPEAPLGAVAAQFGPEFAAQLAGLPLGQWSGPVRSGYGSHLVLLTARTESRLPTLDEVRERVVQEVLNDRRLRADREFMDGLLAKYRVRVEWPETEDAGAGAAGKAPGTP